MKRITLYAVICLLLSGCGTYAGSGAYAGAHLGSVLGSAIGGISGGYRGSNIGTVVGMVGGAAVGASVGSAADQRKQSVESGEYGDDSYAATSRRHHVPSNYKYDGNERSSSSSELVIKNLRYINAGGGHLLRAGDNCKIVFEVHNNSNRVLYDVCPLVSEVTGNKHIYISQGIHVEQIVPGGAIRYTAMVYADKRLKNGMAKFRISAVQGNAVASSAVSEIDVRTER